MTEDIVQRVSMEADHQTLIKKHNLRVWVEKSSDWPPDKWNGVVGKVRELYVEAELAAYADDVPAVIKGVTDLVLKRQAFIDHFLEKGKGKLNYQPANADEWRSLADVVARILVQRYYRETQAT